MLIEKLKVTLADLMPAKGVSFSIAGESGSYRISERLLAAVKNEAEQQCVPQATIFARLRDEVHIADKPA